MVSRRLTRAAFTLVAVLAAGLSVPGLGGALPSVDPGPFWPLHVGYEGQAYVDSLPAGAGYAIRAGRLPTGLAMSNGGHVTGTPSETGTFALELSARENASGLSYPVRVALTVRRADERDLPQTATSFESSGPLASDQDDFQVRLTSSFDNADTVTKVRLTTPRGVSGAVPLLMLHHGRGFDHVDYDTLSAHIASYGIAVASVEDPRSFSGRTFRGEIPDYDMFRAELGMQSASGVTEAVTDLLLSRSQDPQDPLFGAFSADDVFFAGHSRGGGAVHGSHERSFDIRLKGLIYLMAFDLRYFQECRPPGNAPAYPIFDDTPRTPSLIIAAENDGDLTYPIADQLIDRATGPTTQVSIYGAVHNLISDEAGPEGDDRISRRSEQRQTADWIVCFIKRWAGQGDASLDRRLYAGGHMASPDAAVAGWYPSSRTLELEDAQDGDPDRNLLGANYVLDMRRRERSFYPGVGDMDSLDLAHTICTPTDTVSAWRMAADTPLDVTGHSRLVLRMTQDSRAGWEWAGVWLRLVDTQGGSSWARLHEPGAADALLPASDSLSPHSRFLDVHVDLAQLLPSSTPADLTTLRAVDLFVVIRDASAAGSVVVDKVRFE